MKITFMGAGSTVFARNVIGDCMCSESLRDSEFALYDIDGDRLKESETILNAMNKTMAAMPKLRHTWVLKTARTRCAAQNLL